MKIGIIVAMEEEFTTLSGIFTEKNKIDDTYETYSYKYKNLEIISIISKIGKVAAASAATILLSKYSCDIIINIGSCGGINTAKIASVLVSNTAGYSDVDATAFGYKLGQVPQQKEYFVSSTNIINHKNLLQTLLENHVVLTGTILTSDSFIADKTKVNTIKNMYTNTIAVEMEAGAIAQICNLYNKDFILIKKVSDMADIDASSSFKEEINKMQESTSDILKDTLEYISNLTM